MFRRFGDPFSDLSERSRRHFRVRFDCRVTDLCASSRPRDACRDIAEGLTPHRRMWAMHEIATLFQPAYVVVGLNLFARFRD
jgi:hypothetical protein